MAWAMGQKRGEDWYWFDSIFIKRTNTQECAKVFVEKIKALNIRVEPQVIVCGDASGKSGSTKTTAKSDYDILFKALAEAGIKYRDETPDANPGVKDRVNTVNAHLQAADGSTHMWLHPVNCAPLKKDLQRVSWKAGNDRLVLDQNRDPDLTHISDGVGYAMCALSKLWKPAAGGLRVIRR
jgi:hypothetical protein